MGGIKINLVLLGPQEIRQKGRLYPRKVLPKLEAWERGEALPSLKGLEDFAKITYPPTGYMFLDEPPPRTVAHR